MLGVVVVAISAVRGAKGAQRGAASDTRAHVCMHFLLKGSQQQQHFTPETQQWRGLKVLISRRLNKI